MPSFFIYGTETRPGVVKGYAVDISPFYNYL